MLSALTDEGIHLTLPWSACSARSISLSLGLLLWLWLPGFVLSWLTENKKYKKTPQRENPSVSTDTATISEITKVAMNAIKISQTKTRWWPPDLKAWMMTVPKRMKRAEKISDRMGIISRLEERKYVSVTPPSGRIRSHAEVAPSLTSLSREGHHIF